MTEIGNEAFQFCESLTSITIPNSVTIIGDWVFYGCTRLQQVELSESLTEIPYFAFGACLALQQISIPEGVQIIGESAFHSCALPEAIWLPATLTQIRDDAFADCSLIWHVFHRGTQEQWDDIRMGDGNTPIWNTMCHHNCVGGEELYPDLQRCSGCCDYGNHDFAVTETAATCTENGFTVNTCTVCGHAETVDEVPAVGHAFGQWEVTKEATRREVGQEARVCVTCGETEQRDIPMIEGMHPAVIAVIAVAVLGVGVAAVVIVLRKKRT